MTDRARATLTVEINGRVGVFTGLIIDVSQHQSFIETPPRELYQRLERGRKATLSISYNTDEATFTWVDMPQPGRTPPPPPERD